MKSQYSKTTVVKSQCDGRQCFYGLANQSRLEFLGRIERSMGGTLQYGYQYQYHAEGYEPRGGFWSNSEDPIPSPGERVNVRVNGMGVGTVVGYFFASDFIGIEVALDKRPEWHVKNKPKDKPNTLAFGSEVTVLKRGMTEAEQAEADEETAMEDAQESFRREMEQD